MRDYCFVAQPFDNDAFDQRFDDIIFPVVKECGLECYRVDRDSAVVVPADAIEEKITKAKLVIVDITKDNPNVWFELGYAEAMRKTVIMVCSDERQQPFPFDIRHKRIITYRTRSQSDFEEYKKNLIRTIRARCDIQNPAHKEFVLTDEEIFILRFIARDQLSIHAITPEEKILKASLDAESVKDCLVVLMKAGLLEYNYSTDNHENYYHVTDKAEKYLLGR